MFYGKNKKDSSYGFFDETIKNNCENPIEISQEYYTFLLRSQSEGAEIIPNSSGYPVLRGKIGNIIKSE